MEAALDVTLANIEAHEDILFGNWSYMFLIGGLVPGSG